MLPFEILRKIKRLEIKTSRLVEGALSGGYLSTFKGRGIEFTEVREYVPGDDVRAIDWNVTARTGIPHIKTFVEERDLTVMLAVDVSASMDFGTTTQTKRELAVEFAAAAALLAAQGGDRAGLIAYTDRVELFIPPKRGKRHVYNLLTALSTIKPKGKKTDMTVPAELLIRALKTRSTLFWISDFTEACLDGGSSDAGLPATRALKALSKRHELVPVVPTDRREAGGPASDWGVAELKDPETGEVALVDFSSPAFIHAFKNWRDTVEKERAALFNSLKAEPVWLATGDSPITPLARYFHRQARRR
jgi:uncharacterized protein (DUF58 family)